MEEFIVDGVCIIYRGYRFRKQNGKKYYIADTENIPERLLHRYVWYCNVGPIERGMHIHHKDENMHNNAISNLEKIEGRKHQSMHMQERWANGGLVTIAYREGLERAIDKAKDWHKSEEGIAWHKEHGKNSWIGREYFDKTCEKCGSAYKTPVPHNSRFCSRKCITKNANDNYTAKQRAKRLAAKAALT